MKEDFDDEDDIESPKKTEDAWLKKEEPWYNDEMKCIKYMIRHGIKGKKFVFSTDHNEDKGKDVQIKLSFDL